jgi:hypothetical protein
MSPRRVRIVVYVCVLRDLSLERVNRADLSTHSSQHPGLVQSSGLVIFKPVFQHFPWSSAPRSNIHFSTVVSSKLPVYSVHRWSRPCDKLAARLDANWLTLSMVLYSLVTTDTLNQDPKSHIEYRPVTSTSWRDGLLIAIIGDRLCPSWRTQRHK